MAEDWGKGVDEARILEYWNIVWISVPIIFGHDKVVEGTCNLNNFVHTGWEDVHFFLNAPSA